MKAIDDECEPFEKGRHQAESEVEFLRQYQTRLTANVVTGQIDVREAAVHLADAPATLEDDELLAEEVAESDVAELDDAEAEIPA